MHAFCLPGSDPMLSNTVSFLRTAMNFYSTECGSYPFGSYKLVFVDELPTSRVFVLQVRIYILRPSSLMLNNILGSSPEIEEIFPSRPAPVKPSFEDLRATFASSSKQNVPLHSGLGFFTPAGTQPNAFHGTKLEPSRPSRFV